MIRGSGLVEDYSGRGLTKTEDKLVAISGLTKLIEVQSGGTNIAGLWKEALVACLLWTPKPSFGRRLIHGVPSWHWASIEGAVSYDGLYGSKLHLQTFDEAMHADWEVDVIEVSSTTLVIRWLSRKSGRGMYLVQRRHFRGGRS